MGDVESLSDHFGIGGLQSDRAAGERIAQLEAELQAAQGLLLECHGWMNGVEPKPAQPFLDAVLAAAQRTEEPGDG